jgi:hypothetical protein
LIMMRVNGAYLLARPACMTMQNPLRVMLEARCENVARQRRGEEGDLEAASASFNLVRAT